ncbi:hypothetical protein GCM10011390_37370 [Aureimonas endophytica]|uniref:DUF817 family protein n=1 Tax=Aureimonas endophytica TaxID=2027858 RepID=A0A916ZUN5_9HYPH|nr:hypothetical protein GCM10011390_37370 [Aureimonas endophytica]
MLETIDHGLLVTEPRPDLRGLHRILVELLFFGLKEARACLFAGLFFLAIFIVPRHGLSGIPRYDLLLAIALAIQGWMLWRGIETLDEAKTVLLFHIAGFGLEAFKTSGAIQSWSYADFA